MTFNEFIKKNNLEFSTIRIPFRKDIDQDEWSKEAKHYAFVIKNPSNSTYEYQGYYSMGSALTKKPQLEEVLNSLVMDTLNIDVSFKEWASEYGYSDDSVKAHKLFALCEEEAEGLKKLFTTEQLKELYDCEAL